MAFADYYLCDVCSNKAFYDANITDCRYTGRFDQTELDEVWGVIDIKVLCPACAKTHEVIVQKRKSS